MKILCSADLHLGRWATRLPPDLDNVSASEGWRALVRLAIAEEVDLVLLAGDVVDRANRFFEAFGPLEEGLRTLAAAAIPVVAVAGNHDFDVLQRLADNFSPAQFRLLGKGGRWERFTYSVDGQDRLHIDGWSFPAEHWGANPLDSYNLPPPAAATPHIGLLHGDLNQGESRYAPVMVHDLTQTPAKFWLLGHVHRPQLIVEHDTQILYPGSPLALHPGERGPHGPWLVELKAGREPSAAHVPQSVVRYEAVEVNLTGIDEWQDLDSRLIESLRDCLEEVVDQQGASCSYLLARLTFTGRSSLHRQINGHLAETITDLELTHEETTALVENFHVATRPVWPLEQLAESAGPPGALARQLLALQNSDSGQGKRLLRAARDEVRQAFGPFRRSFTSVRPETAYSLLAPGGVNPAAAEHGVTVGKNDEEKCLANLMLEQGYLLLDELMAQKEARQE